MPKIAELAACELAIVAGGEDCINPNPEPETFAEMIRRFMQPITIGDDMSIN